MRYKLLDWFSKQTAYVFALRHFAITVNDKNVIQKSSFLAKYKVQDATN